MVAIKPSLATKFLVLQVKGVEFDTKPCSENKVQGLIYEKLKFPGA
jgi:hypothetical protein